MASIDYEGDIDRIIAILKNNTTIWDLGNIAGKLRSIQFGEADGLIYDDAMPYAIVTVPNRPFLSKDQFGIGDNSTDPQHSIQYMIKVIVKRDKSENAERQLYGFIKEIVDTLKANPRLKEPVGLTDPKCIRSFVFDAPMEPSERGKNIQIATIIIQCQIGEDITLVYDGVTIPVLEEVNSIHGWTTQNVPDDDGLIDVAPVNLEEKMFFRIETNATLDSTLRTKIRTWATKSMTVTKNGVARVITNAILSRKSPTIVYDQIPQALLEIQIIKDSS